MWITSPYRWITINCMWKRPWDIPIACAAVDGELVRSPDLIFELTPQPHAIHRSVRGLSTFWTSNQARKSSFPLYPATYGNDYLLSSIDKSDLLYRNVVVSLARPVRGHPVPDRSLVDEARIFVQAGAGGNGIASFRREKYVPRGGPDGGDGGRGGDVILRASRSLNTLAPFAHRTRFAAERGGHGAGATKHGKRGEDVVVDVPIGTVVVDGPEPIADLTHDGQQVIVARGGKGGLGNVHFATSTNRAPRMARKGEPGAEAWLNLELKTIGDVGLVGEPNAGKSSLLAALSAARPEIADYPFTTLAPNLRVTVVGDVPFVVVDIPG